MKYFYLFLIITMLFCKTVINEESNDLANLEYQLDSLFNQEVKRDEPGAALLVAYNGKKLIAKGYGLRDLDKNLPITSGTNMEMASVSKQFTALSILALVDQGKLSLSDELYGIFPYESFQDITIEQLINHSSGLEDAEAAFFSEWDQDQIASNEDILEWYSKENRKVSPPGEVFKYNNGAYEIIPTIVEKVSGQDYAQFVKEYVFEKAGMDNTNFYNLNQPIDIKEKAYYYDQDSTGTWNIADGHFLTGVLGAGGVYTSVDDYFNYDQALRKQSIFSKETHDLIFKPSFERENGSSYAMGWGVTDTTAIHTGGWFGVNTYTKRYLNRPLTIAIFMNRATLFDDDLVNKADSLVYNYVINLK